MNYTLINYIFLLYSLNKLYLKLFKYKFINTYTYFLCVNNDIYYI